MFIKKFLTTILTAGFIPMIFLSVISAQDAANQSMKAIEIKGRVPVSRENLDVNLPPVQKTVLKNGLEIVLMENREVPMFRMQMNVRGGGLAEPKDKQGTAMLTAALLKSGTPELTYKEITERLDRLGASLNGSSGLNDFDSNVFAVGLKENFAEVLKIFADVITNPVFPESEVTQYVGRYKAQMQYQKSLPSSIANEQLYRAIYADHPMANVFPSADSLDKITPADLKEFHEKFYRPNNATLFITGDMSIKELLPKLKKVFSDWKRKDVDNWQCTELPAMETSKIYLIDRPGAAQTTLKLGTRSIRRTEEDFYALQVLNEIFGAGPASRLFDNLRESKGYTYGAYSNITSGKCPGYIEAAADVRTEVTADALKEFLYEIKQIRDEKVSVRDLENAKRALIGKFAVSLDNPNQVLLKIVERKIYDLPENYWETYPQKINQVTAEDVRRAAEKYFDPDTLQIVAVGDESKIREGLKKFGKIVSP